MAGILINTIDYTQAFSCRRTKNNNTHFEDGSCTFLLAFRFSHHVSITETSAKLDKFG